MAKTKIFVSFDYDNDVALKETLIAQSKMADSPFSINDVSLKEKSSEWQKKARKTIDGCDVFILLLGNNTYQANGVIREVRMARQLGKKRFQLRKQGNWPTPVEGPGGVVAWKWENLKVRLAN